jgi:putative membrane protein
MLQKYSDHAANERTFLAWVRTGIATIAFGFVIEKFNLFIATLEKADTALANRHHLVGKLSGMLGDYDGAALIFIGIALILVASTRFVRTARLIDDETMHSSASVRIELVLSLVLVVAALVAFITLL